MNKIKNTLLSLAVSAASLSIAPSLQANELDLALGEDSIKLSWANPGALSKRSQMNVSYYHHSDDVDMIDLDLLVGDASAKSNALIGGKAFYVKTNNLNASGIALGVTGEYALPKNFFLKGKLFYAPSMLTFSDADNYHEFEARVAYQMIPEAELSLGYRHVGFDLENSGDVKIQDQAFLALTLNF